ncbi:MAG: hypothetical protein E6K69_03230 [Nitrospirae bacterium]|nr:MAG: hypothetical protein E6K69_03230 [Nitrospirota bacterium]
MDELIQFTPDELSLIADEKFFLAKARVMRKVRHTLEGLYAALKIELAGAELLAPKDFDLSRFQFVKGEHLEDFPYQYLDFPKHFLDENKFAFRSLFWWGHHFVFALILEGEGLLRYKRNLINRYHDVAGRHLCLCLGPSLWEWKRGEGHTLPMTHDRKSEVAAVLSDRPFFKVARFVSPDDPAVLEGRIVEIGRDTFRAVLPIITP